MNKRQAKKLKKKFGCKNYYNVRRWELLRFINNYPIKIYDARCPFDVITTSRRDDYKHIRKIELYFYEHLSENMSISESTKKLLKEWKKYLKVTEIIESQNYAGCIKWIRRETRKW